LRTAGPGEVATVVAWLSGELRQGRVGAGWRTVAGLGVVPAEQSRLTVAEADGLLDELAGVPAGMGSAGRRKELLGRLFGAATADEQQFLARLLVGELRHGALEGVMTEAVAAAAEVPLETVRRAFMLSGQLPQTAELALSRGAQALAKVRLKLGRPIRPMLASPGETLAAALAELGASSVEYKLDGARIQVHRNGSDVAVFTRTLRDITAGVPELVALVGEFPCESVVLDGETLALDDAGRPRAFQESMSRFGAQQHELLLQPFFFDCLHLDGTDLLDRPLADRQEALAKAAGPHRIPTLIAPTPEQARAHQAAALDAGHEGVMVKSLQAPYAAGRRGRAWQKIKPEYTLDLIVLAAEWGYGRRTGYLSNLHLGARDPDGGDPVMVGKTFKGLSDELLRWQTETFPGYVRHSDGHTVFLRPELVVEIELDGVQTSPRYPGGVTLRFARVVRYREDKRAQDADTIDAVRAIGQG
jgi:DNA ligase-1